MKIAKNYFTQKEPITYLHQCYERNSSLIRQVLKNNTFLLKQHNISQRLQIATLREQGIKISAFGIGNFKKGIYQTCSLSYLQIFSLFWNIDLVELIVKDFETEAINSDLSYGLALEILARRQAKENIV